ncbi:5-formyltetrahydrofolate cyclo-ligase [Parasphingopyxis sp. CP4]|uniref:5-formyltetrahydrofolate cyclo-ligase n=1 Tax=Parasphingopyxis sp. CP4 TaxID=2724527 RepID=UPI0015A138E4|nr:5-formyltetrahydrofolate cyclo-ligase [Parasphingopyxis sp. CP4]QLC21708.1 5-formyltetrahydrofolate cyclo-ligase [Parasphingopyxis sp. CP4]
MTKPELRAYFRKVREEYVFNANSIQLEPANTALFRQLEAAGLLAGIIGGYAAMTSEIDPLETQKSYVEKGGQVALPFFTDRQSPMEFREWTGEALTAGPFGLRQPAGDAPKLSPNTLLIPLVAVDRAGNRVGQGQGHYDRYLAENRAKQPLTTIGLAWECQIAEEIPADPWDEPLDYIATPERLIKVTS